MSGLGHRLALWQAAHHRVSGFLSQPQPKAIGEPARAQHLLAGKLFFAGELVEIGPEQTLWDIDPPSPDFSAALHGFAWLDDLASLGAPEAMRKAQLWTIDWVVRNRARPANTWAPWLTGRRQTRWITHGVALMNGMDSDETRNFIDILGQQARVLGLTWQRTNPGLSRFEALTGYVHSATALAGMEAQLPRALRSLASTLDRDISADGTIASRNPEELLEIFALLTWTAEILRDGGHPEDPSLTAAIARIAPVLRALRHADGGLARFQGGGRGRAGLLDLALRQARLKPAMAQGPAMGFARLAAERVTVLADAAAPLLGRGSGRAHASSLAFQMTSGRDPMVVSCGAGVRFGPEWRRAGRASPSHSTLVLDGYSSARMARFGAALADGPRNVLCTSGTAGGASTLALSHDGWRETHGLTHLRNLALAEDGRQFAGEDNLAATEPADRKILDSVLQVAPDNALAFKLHFHLHPQIDARIDMGGQAISLLLPSGELWVFRASVPGAGRAAQLALAPSVYLDARHIQPRATKQIILIGRLSTYASAILWSFTCPAGTPKRRRRPSPMLL